MANWFLIENKKYIPDKADDDKTTSPKNQKSYAKDAVETYDDEALALFIDNLIELWDTNDDGYITYYEYRSVPTTSTTDSSEEDSDNDVETETHHHHDFSNW